MTKNNGILGSLTVGNDSEDIYGTANTSAHKPAINFTGSTDSLRDSQGITGSIKKTSNKLGGEGLLLNQPSVDEFAQLEEEAPTYGIPASKKIRNRESGTLGTISMSNKEHSVQMKDQFVSNKGMEEEVAPIMSNTMGQGVQSSEITGGYANRP